jgi:hypothetical protein
VKSVYVIMHFRNEGEIAEWGLALQRYYCSVPPKNSHAVAMITHRTFVKRELLKPYNKTDFVVLPFRLLRPSIDHGNANETVFAS